MSGCLMWRPAMMMKEVGFALGCPTCLTTQISTPQIQRGTRFKISTQDRTHANKPRNYMPWHDAFQILTSRPQVTHEHDVFRPASP